MHLCVKDIDWKNWDPKIRATLMFIIKDEEVLLIHKKTGLGQGKINGPGGKIELNETPYDCAIRETLEEVCVEPVNIQCAGELFFQFTDGLTIHGYVYRADNLKGMPQETIEANPFWCSIHDIPYDKMWEDDITWFPYLLSNNYFKGYYIFDNEVMLDAVVKTNIT